MTTEISDVAVIGSGVMGHGIALVFAQNGYSVSLMDIEQTYLEKAVEKIKNILQKGVSKGKITEQEYENTLTNIKITTDLEKAVKGKKLVIEAIIEDEKIKKELFQQLQNLCDVDSILATNTSAISITGISKSVKYPANVIGMHFFNPPNMMKLVEIVKGEKTAENVVATVKEIVKKMDKIPVLVNEAPGFIVNRLLWQFLNEAYKLVEQGVATKEDIDQAVKLGLNHPMGPFELTDYIGLDVMLAIGEYLETQLDTSYKPSQLLNKMVSEGKLGKKTQKGFYEYNK